MQDPYRKVFGKQKNAVTPATFKKGIINAIFPESATANVSIVGNIQTILKNIPIASTTNVADVKVGDKCRIDMFDETNPQDSVVAYIYGRAPSTPRNVIFFTTTVDNGGSGLAHVLHNLTDIPNLVVVIQPNYNVDVVTSAVDTYIYDSADATKIYLAPVGKTNPGSINGFKIFAAII